MSRVFFVWVLFESAFLFWFGCLFVCFALFFGTRDGTWALVLASQALEPLSQPPVLSFLIKLRI